MIMIAKIILLSIIITVPNIKASPILVDTTKSLVLSKKSPYVELEIIERENLFEFYTVVKPMNKGDKINILVYRYDNKSQKITTIIDVTSKHEIEISFPIKKDDLGKLTYCATNTPKGTFGGMGYFERKNKKELVFPDSNTVYIIENIRDFLKRE